MNVIRLIIEGFGSEVVNCTLPEKEFIRLDKSGVLDDVWVKDLYKTKIKNKFDFIENYRKFGLISGDISIEIDGNQEFFSPLTATQNQTINIITTEKTNNLTIVQNYKGVFLDTTFILKDTFNIDKLTINKYYLVGSVDNILVPHIFCDVIYDGFKLNLNTKNTEMITSKVLNNFII
jgi:hypothetical protein